MSGVYDAVIVSGGHNALVAAYLAGAGKRVIVLERLGHLGGAAVSERPWPGVDARLSRYSYLVSLLPPQIIRTSICSSICAGGATPRIRPIRSTPHVASSSTTRMP